MHPTAALLVGETMESGVGYFPRNEETDGDVPAFGARAESALDPPIGGGSRNLQVLITVATS
jgi:hypothetical protein